MKGMYWLVGEYFPHSFFSSPAHQSRIKDNDKFHILLSYQCFWSTSTLNSDASVPRISFKTLSSTRKLLDSFQSALSMSQVKCNICCLFFIIFWVTQLSAEMVEVASDTIFPLAALEEVLSAPTFALVYWHEHQKIPLLPKDELQIASPSCTTYHTTVVGFDLTTMTEVHNQLPKTFSIQGIFNYPLLVFNIFQSH